MPLHESSVNFQNLIRDLAEMYTFEVSEVVVVELVANALDASASQIIINFDPENKFLTVQDNGAGMTASQFNEYHDFAAGLKTRGTGIGFAGVGAKISFNIANRVITETKSISFKGASNWYLESKKKLVWEDIQTNLIENGTIVKVFFKKESNLAYETTEDIIKLLKRYYLPLFDAKFIDLYNNLGYYSLNLKFIVNDYKIEPSDIINELKLTEVHKFVPKRAGKRIGLGLFGLANLEYPLGENLCGVLHCTHGKVIKADFFNQFPGVLGPKIFGLVEIPGFINFLTTAKTDFIRERGKYKQFEALYNPIRQEFKDWLFKVGVQPLEVTDIDEAKKLEKELTKILDDVPELSEFLGFRGPKNVLRREEAGSILGEVIEGTQQTFPIGEGKIKGRQGIVDIGDASGEAVIEGEEGVEKAEPITRIAKRGPKISFSSNPDRSDLAWVEGNAVIINSAHPSYDKIRSNYLGRRVHCLFAIGAAVQRFMAGPESQQNLMFIDRLMAAWGKK